MASFLSLRNWTALLGVALLLTLTGAVWAASPESSVNVDTCLPSTGPIAGGTVVALTGTGFLTGATVTFGGNAATSVSVLTEPTSSARRPPTPLAP